jgi:hypothetical protein
MEPLGDWIASESPVARQTKWLLEVTGARAFTDRERIERFRLPQLVNDWVIDRVDGPWLATVEEFEELTPYYARALIRGPDNDRHALRVGVEEEPPWPIRYASRWHAPEAVSARLARETDEGALADLERRTPVVDGGVQRLYDRTGRWFDQLGLMQEVLPVVAEIDGRIVGAMVDAIHGVSIDDWSGRMLYRMRLRVEPASQGRRVFPVLNGASVDFRLSRCNSGWGFDSEEAFIATDNRRVREILPPSSSAIDWATTIERVVIDCRSASCVGDLESIAATDAELLFELLGASRRREIGYPYATVEQIVDRFERAPDIYGWHDVWTNGEATVGIWNEGVTLTTSRSDERSVERTALALDYGCRAGREDALASLIRTACRELMDRGVTHLAIFTSVGAQLRSAIVPLASRIERFQRRLRIPEPRDAPQRGVYVDPVYF